MSGRRSSVAALGALVMLGGVVALGFYALGATDGADSAETPPRTAPHSKPAAAVKPATRPAPAPAPASATTNNPGTAATRRIGDWTYSCTVATDASPAVCSIQQELADPQTRSTIFIWRISKNSAGTLVADWQTPTGILVNRGMVIDAGAPQPISVPYASCTNQHCDAIANLAPDFIDGLRGAAKATSTVYSLDGKGLTFTFSVNGLTEAINALQG